MCIDLLCKYVRRCFLVHNCVHVPCPRLAIWLTGSLSPPPPCPCSSSSATRAMCLLRSSAFSFFGLCFVNELFAAAVLHYPFHFPFPHTHTRTLAYWCIINSWRVSLLVSFLCFVIHPRARPWHDLWHFVPRPHSLHLFSLSPLSLSVFFGNSPTKQNNHKKNKINNWTEIFLWFSYSKSYFVLSQADQGKCIFNWRKTKHK